MPKSQYHEVLSSMMFKPGDGGKYSYRAGTWRKITDEGETLFSPYSPFSYLTSWL